MTLELRLTYIKATNQGSGYQGTSDIAEASAVARTQKIDPGKDNSFSFYIWNMSNEFVELKFDSHSTLRVIGESADRVIAIEQANPAPILHFSPRPGSQP